VRDCAAACSARIVTFALVSIFSKISCGQVLFGDDLCLLGKRTLLLHALGVGKTASSVLMLTA